MGKVSTTYHIGHDEQYGSYYYILPQHWRP
jgi:hypothetical protein